MDKKSAAKLIHDTFQNPFDKGEFVYFAKNLLNHIEEKSFIYRGNTIPDPYRTHIRTLQRVGKYKDTEGNKIDILVVHLKKEKALERARTMQRNFIAWYLDGSRGGIPKEAALVAFVSPDCEDWRFSLVKMDYKLDTSGKRLGVKKELTPARRHSFLVGKNENSHTAQSRLAPILKDDGHNPTLEELELAFSVEKVTKEFFTKYRDLFHRVEEALKQVLAENPQIKQEFSDKGIETADFAKKLLGQIVFLYFLQKKGWFGVARDADWGTGPKDFLRRLFEKKYSNFFNDILEPLFYEALATERTGDFYSRFNCKVPFLNGGLFDPLANYDWVHTDILLPNELFSNNKKTKEGDIGTGILNVFDRYNFTVKEDEPLEKEVAVDPEMLGKVFENLLKVKDRKSRGTYYTPRAIVHYMCQESLINHLATECENKVPKEDIETLIRVGETAIENDGRVERVGEETKRYSYQLPESIRKNAKLIDGKLTKIKVCDPAVGSGAFLVGMMSEIVRTRNVLSNYINNGKSRSIYNFKHHAIQNSLYGVDIDPGAVEIAKLRLWLSLVVDEEDIKNIHPLPNLDYKIMRGNSLIELLSPVLLAKTTDQERNKLIDQLSQAKREYFSLSATSAKQRKRREINLLTQALVNYDQKKEKDSAWRDLLTLRGQQKMFADESSQISFGEVEQKLLKRLDETSKLRGVSASDHFEWHLNFNEIFEELPTEASVQAGKSGFDVVIANPPYKFLSGKGSPVQKLLDRGKEREAAVLKSMLDEIARRFPDSSKGCRDYYKWFVELAARLAKSGGVISYITPNTFITLPKYADIRKIIFERLNNVVLIDFGFGIFETPIVPSAVFVSQKKSADRDTVSYSDLKSVDRKDIGGTSLDSVVDESAVEVMLQGGQLLLYKHPLAEGIYQRTESSLESYLRISEGEHSLKNDFSKMVEEGNPDTVPVIHDTKIKKWLPADIVYLPSKMCSNSNTSLHEGERFFIRKTGDKIIAVPPRSYAFAVAHQNVYVVKVRKAGIPLEFFIAVLSSKLLTFLYQNGIYGQKGRTLAQFRIYALYLLPLPDLGGLDHGPFIDLTKRIFDITKSNDYLENATKQAQAKEYENRIDRLVYKLYALTEEEIRIVEGR